MTEAGTLTLRQLGLRRKSGWLFRQMDHEIPAGKFVAIVGASGAGKTSLLQALAGMWLPEEGSIAYADSSGQSRSPREFQREIGMVFQNYRLTFNSDLLTNVLCGRLGRHSSLRTLFGFSAQDRADAWQILGDLDLQPRAHHWAAEASGGEQQRTAIARALIQEPAVILADEPVSNLDAALTHRVLSRLRTEVETQGRTVLCVLHHRDHVENFADEELELDSRHPQGWIHRKVRS